MNEISKDFRFLQEVGGQRYVHARGCSILGHYDMNHYGLVEVPKFVPSRMKGCPRCYKRLCLASVATDYIDNLKRYDIFSEVNSNLIYSFCFTKGNKVKSKVHINFVGDRLYISYQGEDWYIDTSLFSLDEIHFFHNNYNVRKRERGESNNQSGFHEHEIPNRENMTAAMQIEYCLNYISTYDFKEATVAHKKKRKKSHISVSKYDPEYYGID